MVDGRFCTLLLCKMKFEVFPSGLGSRPFRIDQSMEFGDRIMTTFVILATSSVLLCFHPRNKMIKTDASSSVPIFLAFYFYDFNVRRSSTSSYLYYHSTTSMTLMGYRSQKKKAEAQYLCMEQTNDSCMRHEKLYEKRRKKRFTTVDERRPLINAIRVLGLQKLGFHPQVA